MPASVLPAGESRAAQADLSRLLGTVAPEAVQEPEQVQSSRLRLLGVVAPRNARADPRASTTNGRPSPRQ